jgi:hypothetical protein
VLFPAAASSPTARFSLRDSAVAAATATAPARARSRAPVCPVFRQHDLGHLLGNRYALFLLRLRRPFVFRTEISPPSVARSSPIPKRVQSAAVCRASCNVPSVVCCRDASIVVELLSSSDPEPCPCPLPSRLNSKIRAKPPANPMDIACPASSTWVALNLIRFRKRPLHFAAVTEGVFARQSAPLDGPFQEGRCACARLVSRRIPAP